MAKYLDESGLSALVAKLKGELAKKQGTLAGENSIEVGEGKVSLKTDNSGNVKFTNGTSGLSATVDVGVTKVESGSGAIEVAGSAGEKTVALKIAQQQDGVSITQENGLKVTLNVNELFKDKVVESGEIVDGDGQNNTEIGEKYLKLTIANSNTPVYINVKDLVDVYTGGDGITVDDYEISINVDTDSESFLTVGEDGIKLDGVQDAIDEAVSDLNDDLDEVKEYTVNGKKISENPELKGEDIKVGTYSTSGVTGDVTSADTIPTALAKLANKIQKAQEGSVASIGDKTGEIKLKNGQTAKEKVNLTIGDDNTLTAEFTGLDRITEQEIDEMFK